MDSMSNGKEEVPTNEVPETPEKKRPLTNLVFGFALLGLGAAIFLGLSEWIDTLKPLSDYKFIAYIWGGVSIALSVLAIWKERKYKVGLLAFGSGVGAILVEWLLIVIAGAIVIAVLAAILSEGL